jgi:hypothetical protein
VLLLLAVALIALSPWIGVPFLLIVIIGWLTTIFQ